MNRAGPTIAIALYVLVLIAVVVGVDVILLRTRFWERLAANLAIVATFAVVFVVVRGNR